jgi:hypothetical protein
MKNSSFVKPIRILTTVLAFAVPCAGPLAAATAATAGETATEKRAEAKADQIPGQMPAPQPAVVMAPTLPILSLDEVQRGQKGYGLSVFAGTEPERFEVEIVGVMRNMSPDTSYVLAVLTGKGLERSGVAGGMSGSPVFIDGRLVGAVAFSWAFTNEALAGITPIAAMRDLSSLKGNLPPAMPGMPPPVPLADLAAGRIPADLLERELARLRPQLGHLGAAGQGAQASVQWTTTGFGEMSQGVLRRVLGNVTAAGQAAPRPKNAGPHDLPLGGAVAAVLVDGDFRIAVSGTVTDRYRDQVLAFGHPFLGVGPILVPMARSEVLTIMSSQNSSFKLSNVGEIIGAFEQDRQAGIQGRLGVHAPMIPMTLKISGVGREQPREYEMRLADLPFFTPLLMTSSYLAGLDSTSYSTGPQGIDLFARLKMDGQEDVVIRQSFDSDNAATESAAYLLSVASYLVQNPMQKLRLRGVEVEVEQSVQPRAAALVGAHADRTVVRPGERVQVNLDLAPYRGERFRHSVKVDLPEDLPAGRYTLLVGDGASADATRLGLEPADPVTLQQALAMLRSFHSRRDLVVLGVYGGAGLSVAGEVMPRLPGSVRSVWGAAASGSATPLRSTIAQKQRETMPVPIEGLVRIDLEVRRREPVTGEAGAANPQGQPGKGVQATVVSAGAANSEGRRP